MRLKRGSELWCGVQRKKEEWDEVEVSLSLLFSCEFSGSWSSGCGVLFCSVVAFIILYYSFLSMLLFQQCSEKREPSLVMPLQEDQIQTPKLPLDVLSCEKGVVIIQHLKYFCKEICYLFDRSSLRAPNGSQTQQSASDPDVPTFSIPRSVFYELITDS